MAGIVIAMFCAVPALRAQKEANIWYFGRGAGIDFNGGVPTAVADGAIDQKEGCASIADPMTGALLFYTDGVTVWNRQHRPMPNGAGLAGHADATQSALIVPAPCEPRRFYVFTADANPLADPPNDGIHYSIVDMDADAGRGDVVVKNVQMYEPATEKLTAVRHANGVDWWILSHEWGSNLFRVYQVSSSGVSTAVLSYVGSAHDGAPEYGTGYLKASPDGRMLVSVVTTSTTELFDFDARTGLISNPRRICDFSKYGASFSPDSRLLYAVERHIGWSYDSLYQYDVTLGSQQAIVDSRIAVGGGDYWAMQSAPDGRIYIANNSFYLARHLGWLTTITQPNARGVACGVDERGFRLDVGGILPVVTEGLPNMIESFEAGLIRACGPPEALIGADDPICAGTCTAFRDSSRNLPTQWEWTFEGARPATSSDQNPAPICFDSAGTYRVRLVATNDTGSDTVERVITVRAASSIRAQAAKVAVAPGDTASVPVTLGAIDASATLTSITVRLGYDRSMMRPLGVDAGGALLAGWALSVDDDTASSTVVVEATAAPGTTLAGPGRLLAVRFATWFAGSSSATLPLEIDVPGMVCSTIPGQPGTLDLELCGLAQRLIELDTNGVLLRGPEPNPVSGTALITFRTPNDGAIELAIFDRSGARVATLVDGSVGAGRHEASWETATAPCGVYYCRLSTPYGVRSTPVIVLR
jgi:PKD repeat protein